MRKTAQTSAAALLAATLAFLSACDSSTPAVTAPTAVTYDASAIVGTWVVDTVVKLRVDGVPVEYKVKAVSIYLANGTGKDSVHATVTAEAGSVTAGERMIGVSTFAWVKDGNDVVKTYVACQESDSSMAMQSVECDPAERLVNAAASNLSTINTPVPELGVTFIQTKK